MKPTPPFIGKIENTTFVAIQTVLSLFNLFGERKVRATQSISLPNGKGFGDEYLNHGLVPQKIYRRKARVKT